MAADPHHTLRIDVLDQTETPPALVAAFYWSEALGLRCTDPELLARLAEEGIATPPDGALVRPRDGRAFFDALRWRYAGLLNATAPRPVERYAGA